MQSTLQINVLLHACMFTPHVHVFVHGFCQTPLQLADPTQLQLVGVGVDFQER